MTDREELIRRRIRAAAEDVGDAARLGAEAAAETAEDGIDMAHAYLKRQWRERPLATAGAALGLGVLIGLMMSKR
jgi:ElaB/YqjD/DUF883 family membrane-anchored ribosome-binding protein